MASFKALQVSVANSGGRNTGQAGSFSLTADDIAVTVRRHIPSIKFPTKLERTEQMVVQLIKPATNLGLSKMSPLASSSPVQPAASSSSSGFAKSFRELPARYRRKPLDETEIEYIQRGGPE